MSYSIVIFGSIFILKRKPPFSTYKNKSQISRGKKSGFVYLGFVKTCDELITGQTFCKDFAVANWRFLAAELVREKQHFCQNIPWICVCKMSQHYGEALKSKMPGWLKCSSNSSQVLIWKKIWTPLTNGQIYFKKCQCFIWHFLVLMR